MDPLESEVEAFLRRLGDVDGPLLLAISGGLDSCCLLEVCARLLPATALCVAHFNHLTRGEASDADERFVREAAARLGISFFSGRALRALRGEEQMRESRWHFLRATARELGARYVVTAHHQDDQLETFLMRVLRGSGLDGLGAMAPIGVDILRPFLHVSRRRLESYARSRGIAYREDLSNASDAFFRNRIRSRLVPAMDDLAASFGGAERWRERLGKTMEELRWAKLELERETAERLGAHLVETPFWLRLALPVWDQWTPGWRSRALREIVARLGVATPDRSRIEEAVHSRARHGEISGGATLTRSCGYLYFQSASHRAAYERLAIRRDGATVHVEPLGLELGLRGEMQGLEARFCAPGDRFRGTKLKRLLLEQRIPRPERPLLPVLAHPGSAEVEWFFSLKNPHVTIQFGTFPFSRG